MSDLKNVFKGGWHPKGKDGGKESWRGDFKGVNQVAGWMGKGKTSGGNAQDEHVSRPLATLKDPSAFGPPPKNVNYHGGAALPNEITPHRGGLGAPLSQEEIQSARSATATPPVQEAEKPQKPPAPALPYRSDTTGLRTDNLPAPPTHRDLRGTSPGPTQQRATRPTPNLPPRLPARQNSTEPPPPPYEPVATNSSRTTPTPSLNQSAINRLGNAGVSVPAFGIGKPNSIANPTSTTAAASSPGLSELQSRFSKMNTSFTKPNDGSATASPTATSPQATSSQPPTWKETRSALTTANSAYKDPTSVTMADAQNAAATAQSAQVSAAAFRDRHSETINAAQTRASQLNKRYNMTGRLNRFLEDANNAHDQQAQQTGTQATAAQSQAPPQTQQQPQQYFQQPAQTPPALQHPQQVSPWQQTQPTQPVSSPPPQTSTPELTASISRKPPPPPPPKKPASMQAPPPVPLGTKPSFG